MVSHCSHTEKRFTVQYKGNVYKCEPKLVYWSSNYKINKKKKRVNFKVTKLTKNEEEKCQKHDFKQNGQFQGC